MIPAVDTMSAVERDSGAAIWRRERWLRSFLPHERMTVRMVLGAPLHHSSGLSAVACGEEGEAAQGARCPVETVSTRDQSGGNGREALRSTETDEDSLTFTHGRRGGGPVPRVAAQLVCGCGRCYPRVAVVAVSAAERQCRGWPPAWARLTIDASHACSCR